MQTFNELERKKLKIRSFRVSEFQSFRVSQFRKFTVLEFYLLDEEKLTFLIKIKLYVNIHISFIQKYIEIWGEREREREL